MTQKKSGKHSKKRVRNRKKYRLDWRRCKHVNTVPCYNQWGGVDAFSCKDCGSLIGANPDND